MTEHKLVERRRDVVIIRGESARFLEKPENRVYAYPDNDLPPIENGSLSEEEEKFAKQTLFLVADSER